MTTSRRTFVKGGVAAGFCALGVERTRAADEKGGAGVTREALERIVEAPVLKLELAKEPVIVDSIELLRNGNTYLVRARSTAGVEAITVPNSDRMANVYPLFLKQIVPVFLKQDA